MHKIKTMVLINFENKIIIINYTYIAKVDL